MNLDENTKRLLPDPGAEQFESIVIDGEEWDYEVGSFGTVVSLKFGKRRALSPSPQSDGYQQVSLCKGGKKKHCLVHRLVAIAFHPNPENKCEVDHKNSMRDDNRASNLEWVAVWERRLRGYSLDDIRSSKLTKDDIREIRHLHETGSTLKKMASRFGLSEGNVSRIVNYEIWMYIPRKLR